MKLSVFKPSKKNLQGEYTSQIDYGETQIIIIDPVKGRVNSLTTEIKKVLKSQQK